MKEQEFGRFLRLLTHDLQNVVGAVDLNLQVLPTMVPETSPDMKVLSPFVSRASLACNEMADLLLDVQTFARAVSHADENGSPAPPVITTFDLAARVRDTIMALTSGATARQISVQCTFPPIVLEASGDATMIARAVHVLVNEAVRASFPGGIIDVIVSETMSLPLIEITTTQVGLFDESRPTLALFLARQFLESSQAQIDFFSKEDRSAVRFLLRPA